ncbi:MAG TPA: HAMP domain-containing sensor histidine kinase [Gemmatimonadaceae bacterium]|nr:HAMP domain-containing sensor histidine kinase [Gemmatimonadaceae bacterium]
MNFRARLTLGMVAVAVIPLAILGYGVRREMTARLDADAAHRVDAVRAALASELATTIAADRARLQSLASDLSADNRFRIALTNEESADRRWLLDWAGGSMKLADFAILQLQDSAGRVLSSGQFRNDFDRVAPALPHSIASSPAGAAVVNARTPDGSVRALTTLATFAVRGERFTIIGGAAFDSARVARLSSDGTVAALLELGRGSPPNDAVVADSLPYLDEAATGTASGTAVAHFVLIPDAGPTRALKAGVVRWLLLTLGGTLVLAVIVATLLGRVVSAPINDLAERTARLDLDRLNQKFATGRDDELGALERTLNALSGRLRTSVARLREAERAAATGDLARQVNHDIKNGLAPIRNVLRHLAQTAEREPATLAAVYAERRGTLEASVEYLDELARTYARLSPALGRGATDPRPVVQEVARGVSTATVDLRMPETLPRIRADAVVLHRILDNLVSNAVESLDGNPGTVIITAETVGTGDGRRVRFAVSDTGRGMTRAELDRAFNDFYTTKAAGTGLGLSVVRRLLTDVGGSVKADTAPGEGSTFTIEIPAAEAE